MVQQRATLSEAYCHAMVRDQGVVDVENDYIPRVVQCENGSAGFEALKALAVAARSYLYYKLDRDGEILDSPKDQVYSCRRLPSTRAQAAARATSGQVLLYRGTQIAGFHVAGAKHASATCETSAGEPLRDPTDTEQYVTYNAGRRGNHVEQTSLGLVHRSNLANRGCKSQNGAACLDKRGKGYTDILRFYYGDDIEFFQAQGPCIVPLADIDLQGNTGTESGGASFAGLGLLLAAMIVTWLLVAQSTRGTGRKKTSRRLRR